MPALAYVTNSPVKNTHFDKHQNLWLLTIAFNNDFLIKEQIRLVKKYVTDTGVTHIIVDNSSVSCKRQLIREICLKEQTNYISLPWNWFSNFDKRGSYSHGMALNWCYYNLIRKYQPIFFGFIDHDLFPIHPYSIIEKLSTQPFYGQMRDRDAGWYLWPGFCFFRFGAVSTLKLNFMPTKIGDIYLDSGGSNFREIYSKYDKTTLHFCEPVIAENIREGGRFYADMVHYIDRYWLHAINGSNHAKLESKDEILANMLSKY
jgi:hypothetical protein